MGHGRTFTHDTSYTFNGLSDGQYVILVNATDEAGNEASAFAFLVVDTVPPTVTSSTPSTSGISTLANVTIAFSEPMNGTATTISVNGISGTLSWSSDSCNATFIPSTTLIGDKEYTVTVNGMDLAGNHLTTTTWTFTTADVGTISGMVVDANGNAVANATVILGSNTTTTNANGQYAFYDVPLGNYTIFASKVGYRLSSSPIDMTSSDIALGGITADQTIASNGAGNVDSTYLLIGVIAAVSLLAVGAYVMLVRRTKGGKVDRAADRGD